MRKTLRLQKENEEKQLQLQQKTKKQNEERLFQLLQGNKEKEQENEEKQQRFFLELQKRQEAFFKSLQIVLQFSLIMLCGMRSKHLSTHQMKIRPWRHITEDMKISILPTVPIGLTLKKFGYYYES